MKRLNVFAMLLAAGLFSTLFIACEDNPSDTDNDNEEFIAEQSSFADYKSWTMHAGPFSGPDPALGDAHEANNDNVERVIYVNKSDAAVGTDGEYANGTIFLKEMRNRLTGEAMGITAMAKRGGTFAEANNGWEWFMITPDGTIDGRGDDLMNGLCAGCHAGASDMDYVFTTKGSVQEFVAEASDFADYESWQKVTGPLSGPDPALGDAHEANNDDIERTVYVNKTDIERGMNGEYPPGTIFLKELKQKSTGDVLMHTVMAKRAGTFNEAGNGWEWFTLDDAGAITGRGDDLMSGACSGCHSGVSDMDYVFTK